MQSNQSIEITPSQCHLCEQKMNPAAYPLTKEIVLCQGCYHHMERLPEVVIKSVERFFNWQCGVLWRCLIFRCEPDNISPLYHMLW